MLIKQISVFLENKPGRMNRVTQLLRDASIDLKAATIADTEEFGILRIIVAEPEKALAVLKENDFFARTTNVLAVVVDDTPGGLNQVLEVFAQKNISVEYLYSMVQAGPKGAVIIVRVKDSHHAVELLQGSNITIIPGEELFAL